MGRPTTNTPASVPRGNAATPQYNPPPHLCYAPLVRPIPLPHVQGSLQRQNRYDTDATITAHPTGYSSSSASQPSSSFSSHTLPPRTSRAKYHPEPPSRNVHSNALRISGMRREGPVSPTHQHDVSLADNGRPTEPPSPRASTSERPPLDMRCYPPELMRARFPSNAQSIWSQPAVPTGANVIRVISPSHCWSSVIRSNSGAPLTFGEFFTKLHQELHLALDDSDWSLADERKRVAMVRAHRARRRTDQALRRIDWLEDQFVLHGLYKDEALARQRLMPGRELLVETWVAKFGSS